MSTVIAEGDVDRALVTALALQLDVPKPASDKAPGRDAAIERAGVAAQQVGKHDIVLLLDRNSHSEEELIREVTGVLQNSWSRPDLKPRGSTWEFDSRRTVRLVTAGLPNDERLLSLGINHFMADDYLLALCMRDDSLHAFCAKEKRLSWSPKDAVSVIALLTDVATSFRQQGIVLTSSKRYVHLFKAATGFEASRATFAQNLVARAPEGACDEVLGDLRRLLITQDQ